MEELYSCNLYWKKTKAKNCNSFEKVSVLLQQDIVNLIVNFERAIHNFLQFFSQLKIVADNKIGEMDQRWPSLNQGPQVWKSLL